VLESDAKEMYLDMKKILVAALGFALLSGTAVFAQNTSTGSTDTMSGKKHKKSKKSKSTMSDTSATATSTK
jgi:hypothetical protein